MPNFAALALASTLAAAGTPVTMDGLTSTAPDSWKEVPTTSQMRFKQFSIPRAPGDPMDAELVIFYFGPGQGGDADANITRWKAMFTPPEGKKVEDVSKVDTVSIGAVKATLLDIHGTYKPSSMMGPPQEPRPNSRMISVVFASPQGPYFMRFVGPERTIERHKSEFDKWLRGFKAGKDAKEAKDTKEKKAAKKE
jgi:hypothetical protein